MPLHLLSPISLQNNIGFNSHFLEKKIVYIFIYFGNISKNIFQKSKLCGSSDDVCCFVKTRGAASIWLEVANWFFFSMGFISFWLFIIVWLVKHHIGDDFGLKILVYFFYYTFDLLNFFRQQDFMCSDLIWFWCSVLLRVFIISVVIFVYFFMIVNRDKFVLRVSKKQCLRLK